MDDGVITSVRTISGETDTLPIRIGLHQYSILSPYLFALVLDGITRQIQDEVPVADDIVIIDDARVGNNNNQSCRENLKVLN